MLQVEELSLPNTTPSFHTYQVEQVAADIKESICRTADSTFDEEANSNVPTVSYEVRRAAALALVCPQRFAACRSTIRVTLVVRPIHGCLDVDDSLQPQPSRIACPMLAAA